MVTRYETKIYYALKAFLFLFPLLLILISVLLLIAAIEHNFIFAFLGLIAIFISPFFFEIKIKERFTKPAIIELNEGSFTISIFNRNGIDCEKQHCFTLSEIKATGFISQEVN